jgi:hypothetical protein
MAKAKTPRANGNGKKQTESTVETNLATMPTAASTMTPALPELKKFAPPTPINVEEEIRRRAYELYMQRGCTPGQDHSDWVEAELEIMARYTQQSA